MEPYFVVLAVVLAVTVVGSTVSRRLAALPNAGPVGIASHPLGGVKFWTPFDFAIVAVLVCFSALRYEVGTDYGMYLRFFALADPNGDWAAQIDSFQQEWAYGALSLALKTISDDPFAIFWVTSILTVVPIYAVLRKHSKDLPFAVLLYVTLAFYVAPFNIVRQGVAMALNFWAYTFLNKRQWWAFVLINMVAALFHSSAIVAAIIQVGARAWKPEPRSTTIVLAASVLGAAALWQFPAILQIAGSLNERYATYIGTSDAAGVGTYLLAAAYLILALIVLALRRYVARPDWLALLILGVVFLILGTQAVVPARMFYFFGIFAILVVPNALAEREKSGVLKGSIIAGSTLFFVFYLMNYASLLPYQTYLN